MLVTMEKVSVTKCKAAGEQKSEDLRQKVRVREACENLNAPPSLP
jgi:hypothetical protein